MEKAKEAKPEALNEAPGPIQPQRLRKLLKRLVDIYSPSGKEGDVLDYARGWLKRQGLEVHRQEVDDRRYNLVVAPENGEVKLALIGHLDTVTAYDLENLGCEDEGDELSGLGAADMKGGCAAMMEAFAALAEGGETLPPVALALVVGEEEDGDGAEALAREYHFPWAIIGEPTDLQPCLEHHGYLELELYAKGRRRHASLAKPWDNPVREVLRLLVAISGHLDDHHAELVYNIRDIHSWPEGFMVPEGCQAWVDIHLPSRTPLGELTMEVEEVVLSQENSGAGLDTGLRLHTVQNGYRLPERGPVVEALKRIFADQELSWKPQAFPSHSDANQLWAAGVRPILLGPGRLEMSHVPEEAVSFSQVLNAAQIYYRLAKAL
jgi:acetylornithine deacetylase